MIPSADRLFVAVTTLWLVTSPLPAFTQPPVSGAVTAPARLTAAERDAALASIQAELQRTYVFPEKRAALVERLERERKAGRYNVDSPAEFAERVTADLSDASKDRHLYLVNDAARYAASKAPRARETDTDAYWRQRALREHHGLTVLRVLPGNVRYLKVAGFHWVQDETGTAYDDALRFLKDGDAIIIDLRDNGGGAHAAVRYLVSHFLDGDVPLLTFLAGSKPPEQSRTLEHLPAGRLMGKPLYVLINPRVGSAAEEFAYHVQQLKLGELIGARTAGAANNNTLVPVAPCFVLSVSHGRPVHAVSQTNWEGVGIAPDVETPPEQALEVAQSRALKKLLAAPGLAPALRSEYTWAQTTVEAGLHPVSVPPRTLKALAGRFGPNEVSWRDGTLWLRRGSRPPVRLTPLTAEGLFSVEGYEVLRARLTGKALELLWSDTPEPAVFARG
ncbi:MULTISPECIES: S41 family peptidase [unclassified Corallococcus]|uniref:S41 family peptidase n=1 Tax=unclassified Corallococcus TaxID=2685029 RepID=UPI001A8D1AAE|nr:MULTISPECIES: S41 family peptidase [unclassified Corallococcus]MBN9686446.1 S41 family peptidase [Corallococcus sp. NCSPR001]WAS82126.1 S41 family peptidase [Corallococcus sp. NCRR]